LKKHRFPQLDGLRGWAAMIVLAHHFWPGSVRWDPTGGRVGVDIFFVLSGYLITRSLLRARNQNPGRPGPTLKEFYRRRIRRIVPVYYLALALALFVPAERSLSLVWHAAFLSNLFFVLKGRYVGAGAHLWALAVEAHFYIFWPLLVLWIPRRRLAGASAALIGAGILFRLAAGIRGWSSLAIDVMTPGAFEALGSGAALACWMEHRENQPRRMEAPLFATGAAGFALWLLRAATAHTAAGYSYSLLFTELSRSWMLTWLIAQAVWGIPGWIGAALESAPSRFLGALSYAIYASHNFIFAIFQARPHHLGRLSIHDSQAVLALAATLAASFLLYECVEKPFVSGPSV